MEDNSMLYEHTLLTSGGVAKTGQVYVGWPARLLQTSRKECGKNLDTDKQLNAGAKPMWHQENLKLRMKPWCAYIHPQGRYIS
jgi:hypothetical protein